MMDTRMPSIRRLSAYAIALLIVAGCATPPPPPPPPPAATADTSERSFEEAVQVATDGLMSQLQARSDPAAKTDTKRGIVIDPMVDALSGQQTAATRLLEQRVGERLQTNPQLEVMPFQVASLSKAQYLVTGTMTRIASAQTSARQIFQIDLAATDLKTGRVAAQASSRGGAGYESHPVLSRQPGGGEGQGGRRLHRHLEDSARSAGRPGLLRTRLHRDYHQRGHRRLQQ
jgi:hypothetical protein